MHGTYHKSWGAIQASGGLSRMSRNHIHLAAGLPGDSGVISGMRKSCEVVIWIDVAKAVAAGMRFFTSQNGVVLTPGDASGLLPTQFFHSVVDRATGQQLHSSSSSTSASSSSSTSSSSSSLQASSSAAYEPNYPSQATGRHDGGGGHSRNLVVRCGHGRNLVVRRVGCPRASCGRVRPPWRYTWHASPVLAEPPELSLSDV